jgi:hypothetical protein
MIRDDIDLSTFAYDGHFKVCSWPLYLPSLISLSTVKYDDMLGVQRLEDLLKHKGPTRPGTGESGTAGTTRL